MKGRTFAFTLIEVLLALALAALVMVSLNTFLFSMGELWGRGSERRLFERHVRAVTAHLSDELRRAALPPGGLGAERPIEATEVKTRTRGNEELLVFELAEGSRLIRWPGAPLPEVRCALTVRDGTGLVLLWQSRLETRYGQDPFHEVLVSPYVTALAYDYQDPEFGAWRSESRVRRDRNGDLETPTRLKLTFRYGQTTLTGWISIPVAGEGLPPY
jgi:hypothetical protein